MAHAHDRRTLLACCVLAVLVIASDGAQQADGRSLSAWRAYLLPMAGMGGQRAEDPVARVALRLQRRIVSHTTHRYPLDVIEGAVRERSVLLRRSITLTYDADDGRHFPERTISLTALPHLVAPSFSYTSFSFRVDHARIAALLEQELPEGMRPPQHARIERIEIRDGLQRAVTDTAARSGYEIDEAAAAEAVASALEESRPSAEVAVRMVPGTIVNDSGTELGKLELLATGKSNFKGSGDGRKANVRRGISERVNNVVVQPGADFSFNSTLDRITAKNGWELAYAIFNGGTLIPVPGGGLCQVATTVYRAALNAGFPIMKRANHSLYVPYYEQHGLGLDATIFPGSQDFVFRNETAHPLLVQAYTDGDDAYVQLYGTPDGRSVTLEGPHVAPARVLQMGRALKQNEIAWVRTVQLASGEERTDLVYSRYKSLPFSVVKKYASPLLAAVQ